VQGTARQGGASPNVLFSSENAPLVQHAGLLMGF